jgi:hypothetical protein
VSNSSSFVERCLGGDADLGEIDTMVQGWHEGGDARPLHEYLGMTWPEYQLWVERPESLPAILASRKYEVPLPQILGSGDNLAAAARAISPDEATRVLAWLKKTGRI